MPNKPILSEFYLYYYGCMISW